MFEKNLLGKGALKLKKGGVSTASRKLLGQWEDETGKMNPGNGGKVSDICARPSLLCGCASNWCRS